MMLAIRYIKNCWHLLFADDLKIYKTIKFLCDYLLLQGDPDNFHRWCQFNNMSLNLENKCSVIYNSKYKFDVFNYQINGKAIVTDIGGLGVHLNCKLTYKSHIVKIGINALHTLGFIRRQGNLFFASTIKNFYFTLVRSQLEYGLSVWSHFYQTSFFFLECHTLCSA